MTRRRWVNFFVLSFVPLGIWLLVWFIKAFQTGGLEGSTPALLFVIPTGIYVCLQIWLAIRAFTA
ncbi:MAG: hypothetical protein V3S02_02865 [Dehalococcoidales bacterium]